ncbi:DUF6020 family protein [Leuconostoc gasicomitatum]|uniref:DUF6020 family protein n=1 Tax=Leuconostoc gasicomitatum TaxID=115778 RepID=UPI001CC3C187|nr:DUF6020 family protein [Leuconostoc gasicomitatum]MBZ5955495.1 hypothetical protein [Leuconostoc gasicomitatum]MBZ5984312.1 hypothetical protein [Leuconostoc gasicomitatum]
MPLINVMVIGQFSMAIISFMLVVMVAYQYKVRFHFDTGSIMWSIVFSFFQALNKSFVVDYSFSTYHNNFGCFILQIVIGVLFSYPMFYLGKLYMTQKLSYDLMRTVTRSAHKKIDYWQVLLLFLFVWIIFLCIQLPINISNDGIDELQQFASYSQLTSLEVPLNNHHPVFDTMILGVLFKIGLFIHDNFAFGILFIALVQTVMNATSFAFVVYKLIRSDVNKLLKYFFSIMTLFSPMWLNLNATIVKDNLLITPFIFWFYIFAQLIIDRKKVTNTVFSLFLLLSIVISLMRPNTFYVVIVSLVSLLLLDGNKIFRFKVLIVSILTTATVLGYNEALSRTKIIPAKNVEMLSVPLQQTARVLRYNRITLNNKEQGIVNNIIAPSSIKNYNPQVSDPIKGSYNWNGKNSNFNKKFKAFLPIWLKLGLKYPKTYFNATYANIFGYIDVINRDSGQGQVLFTYYDISSKVAKSFNLKKDYISQEQVNNKNSMAHQFIKVLNAPIINIYQNMGLWSWCLSYVFVTSLFHFKLYKRETILVLPSLLTLGTLFLSPVNGLNRYYIPIFLMLPIIVISLKVINTKLEKNL